MPFSAYTENAVLGHLLGATTFSKPAALYVALFIGDPANGGVEVSATGYTRKLATFTILTNNATNTTALVWLPATSIWGTITHVAIYDALAAGNQLVTAPLTTSKTIGIGDTLQIQPSTFSITLT